MGTLTEKAEWTEGVRYFESGVIVSGGPDAADNQPIQDLTNRTAWLKEKAALTQNQVETVAADLTGHIEADDPHPQYVTTPEMETRIGRIEFQGQINSDWNATEGAAEILNKPVLAGVATSGQYDDLDGKPQNLATTDDITELANDVSALSNSVATKVDAAGASRAAMLSNTVIPLTLPASQETMLMAQDGYVYLEKKGNTGLAIQLSVYRSGDLLLRRTQVSTVTNQTMDVMVPVQAGDTLYVYYTATGATIAFKFIATEGSKP